MNFKFNCLTDDGATALRDFYQPIIEHDEPGHFRYEAETALAFLAWRDGNKDLMLKHFHNAAAMVVETLCVNRHQFEPQNINQMLTPLLISVTFSSQEQIQKLSAIDRSSWFNPEIEEFIALAELIELFMAILSNGHISLENIMHVEELNNQFSSNDFYRPWISATLCTLTGICGNQQMLINDGINKLLALHERETDEGAWRKRVEGIICLWALVIFRIANVLDKSITIHSPYIPNFFEKECQ